MGKLTLTSLATFSLRRSRSAACRGELPTPSSPMRACSSCRPSSFACALQQQKPCLSTHAQCHETRRVKLCTLPCRQSQLHILQAGIACENLLALTLHACNAFEPSARCSCNLCRDMHSLQQHMRTVKHRYKLHLLDRCNDGCKHILGACA